MQHVRPAYAPNSTSTFASTQTNVLVKLGRRILANTGALVASNLWRIIVSFVLMLLIWRTLGAEGMGYYNIALSYLNLCQVISEAGLPTLLTRDLAQMPTQQRAYFQRALSIQLILACLTWALLVLMTLALPLDATSRRVLWLVGASLPFYAVTSVCQTLFQANERMELLLGVELLVNTLILLLSAVLLWFGGNVFWLAGVLVVTQALSALICLFLLRSTQLLPTNQESTVIDLYDLRQRAAPFYLFSLSDVLLQRLDVILLSFVGSPAITGIYGASDNLVRVLVKLVQSVWRALYPTLSRLRLQSPTQFASLLHYAVRYGLLCLLPAAALATVLAPALLPFYAESYVQHALVFQIAVWSAPIFLLEMYAITVLLVENQPQRSVFISGLHLGVMAIVLPLLTQWAGATGAAAAVILAGLVGAVAGIRETYKNGLLLPETVWRILLASLIAAGIAWLIPLHAFLRLAIGGATYLLLIWWTGAFTPLELRTLWQMVGNR